MNIETCFVIACCRKFFSRMLLGFCLFAINIETCFVIVSCISQLRGEPKPMMLLKLLSRCQWGKLQLPLGSNPDVLQSRCPPFFLQVSVQYKSCRLLVLQDRATGSSGSKPEGIIELWWHSVSMYLHHFSPFHECCKVFRASSTKDLVEGDASAAPSSALSPKLKLAPKVPWFTMMTYLVEFLQRHSKCM